MVEGTSGATEFLGLTREEWVIMLAIWGVGFLGGAVTMAIILHA